MGDGSSGPGPAAAPGPAPPQHPAARGGQVRVWARVLWFIGLVSGSRLGLGLRSGSKVRVGVTVRVRVRVGARLRKLNLPKG